jgi:hypothetical protein
LFPLSVLEWSDTSVLKRLLDGVLRPREFADGCAEEAGVEEVMGSAEAPDVEGCTEEDDVENPVSRGNSPFCAASGLCWSLPKNSVMDLVPRMSASVAS